MNDTRFNYMFIYVYYIHREVTISREKTIIRKWILYEIFPKEYKVTSFSLKNLIKI